MTKYIIKNCPCLYEYGKGGCCNDLRYDQHTLCQDCTDCIMKRIVEKCYDYENTSNYELAEEILSMLEIEELQDET